MARSRFLLLPSALASCLLLAGCGGGAADSMVLRESFNSDDTYARGFDSSADQACEAARRTLLSQGYAIARADGATVEGSKNFQREEEHEQLVLRIVCAPREQGSQVFVSAVQDRYALKKSPTSASVGVGALGSVSLPFGSNDDSLVRVASSTIQDGAFYRNFFQRLQQYLPASKPASEPAVDEPPQPPASASVPYGTPAEAAAPLPTVQPPEATAEPTSSRTHD